MATLTIIEFFMHMIPPTSTHQLKQVRVINGKPVFYEPESVKNARAKLTAHLSKNKPVAPLKGPLSLFVKWCFPAKSHKPGTWRDTRPDTDNLQKLLKDCMTICGFWTDDSQVAQEIIEKFWWDTPGIYICIRQLEDKA
jgi:Holliday junction resolvase RusA-like endonuclease